MDVGRRNFIKGGLALPFATAQARAQGALPRSLSLVLTDIPPLMPSQKLLTVLDPFFTRSIPVAAILDCFDTAQQLLRSAAEIAINERWLFELIPYFRQDDATSRYFQLRDATDLRLCLAPHFSSPNGIPPTAPVVSYFSPEEDAAIAPYAMRAAGFRIHMTPDKDLSQARRAHIETVDWGLLEIAGGIHAGMQETADTVQQVLSDRSGDHFLYLSMEKAASLETSELQAAATRWAGAIQSSLYSGDVYPIRPKDHLQQGNRGVSKYVALVLDARRWTANAATLQEFSAALNAAGLPFSVLGAADMPKFEGTATFCQSDPEQSQPGQNEFCVLPPPEGGQDIHAEIMLTTTEDHIQWSGPRQDGNFHIFLTAPSYLNFEAMTADDPFTDVALLIRPSAIATPILRATLVHQMLRLHYDGKVNFVSVTDFMENLLAPTPLHRRLWSTRRRQVTDPPDEVRYSDLDPQDLLDDAGLAWRFIEKYTDTTTGLCSGTVQSGPHWQQDRSITFWDVASQLHGIISARDLQIISAEDASARAQLLIENLPSLTIAGLTLPPARFRANTLWVQDRDFDACDVGRFLIALDIAVTSAVIPQDMADSLIAGWELEATLQDDQLFSYESGRWSSITESHCSHYAGRGFALWGMEAQSGYPRLPNTPSGDDLIYFLERVEDIGQIATEPHLLEALDLGHSPETRYLADVLFDAQLGWFEDTGNLKCVTESPLNFSPWFSYQGLRLNRSGDDAWLITTQDRRSQYSTDTFYEKAEIISAKAAYLWAAEYPHIHSNRLVSFVRDRARIKDEGFSVGVFANSMQPLENYSDLNTNGIILSAIARILLGPVAQRQTQKM